MRAAFSLLLLSATAVAAPAAAQPAPRPAPSPNIIVTGIPVDDFRAALAACLARGCPPDEDIDATLALAEALMLEGEYRAARSVVRDSLRRNRDQVQAYAEPVSDLWRANARLARHIGLDQEALRSTYETLGTLREGIAAEDHRHFTARLEVAMLELRMGRLDSANRELAALAAAARAAGRDDVAATAEMRMRLIDYAFAPDATKRELAEIAHSTDPADRHRSAAARVLLAAILHRAGETAEADALLAGLPADGGQRGRQLLYSPHYVLNAQMVWQPTTRSEIPAVRDLQRLTEDFEHLWIDVGFWVLPDGRVSGLELVRHGADAGWAQPLLRAIEGRRYSTADAPTYRLERYTLTAGFGASSGTRLQRQNGAPRVEYFDLTAGQEYPPRPPPTPASG